MAAAKLSAQDKKDLEKYTRYLALKSIQIIVQSRLGDKVKTQCKTAVTDWFSLAVADLPEVSTEAKRVLHGDTTINRLPLCVEISLKTIDNDQMILENWSFGILHDQFDPGIKMTCAVYNRMSVMLKSLVSVTRVTPAYKLSRRQGPDSFIIYYRIYLGEPQHQNLGEGHKQLTIGKVCSPIGTFYMSVAYRTKMTITPMQTQQGTSIMVKSDHFHSDLSPKQGRYSKQSNKTRIEWNERMKIPKLAEAPVSYDQACSLSSEETNFCWVEEKTEKKPVDLDKPMRPGAFVDASKIKQYETDFFLQEEPHFSWLLEDFHKKDDTFDTIGDMTDEEHSLKDDFLDNIVIDEDLCSLSLPEAEKPSESEPKIERNPWNVQPDDNDIMRELTCPFATAGPVGELAHFYRECFNAPPLQSFMEAEDKEGDPALAEDDPIMDIIVQFEKFETSLQEYDQMVSSLCQSPNNN